MAFTRTRVTGAASQDTYSSYTSDSLSPEVGRNSRTDADMNGIKSAVGRGETDQDITYLELLNENGDPTFIYPNAAQNGVVVSGTRP